MMTREEAKEILQGSRITSFRPNGTARAKEALNMAIESLSAPSGDLISRADAIRWVKTECNPYGKPTLEFESGKRVIEHLKQMPSADAENRLYIKIYADDEPSVKAEKLYQICGETQNREVTEWLKEYFPSADAVQGEWVRKYDEKINCYLYECDQCGEYRPRNQFGKEYNANFCPNCGAKMFPSAKLNNPCNSLLTDEPNGSKEHKSKLDLISRADAINTLETEKRCTDREEDVSGLTLAKLLISALPSADAIHSDGVFVPNMEMPKACDYCLFHDLGWSWCKAKGNYCGDGKCPLIVVRGERSEP